MNERVKYFKSKFIRSGIVGFAISVFLIYSAIAKSESINPILFIIPVVAFVWLYFGFWINKKLKSKNEKLESFEIKDERISFKQVDIILTALLIAVTILVVRHLKYADYLVIPVAIFYFYWLYSQVKLLDEYFKA